MNFGEIKSFLKGTSLFDVNQANGPQSHAEQIRPNLSKIGSSAAIVERSQSNVLSFSVLNKVVGDKLAHLDPNGEAAQATQQKNESLFDFEQVANNVLSFVEKAVMKAKGKGADDEHLSGMLDKARQGIDDGFGQAREELAGMGQDTDEVNEGIDKSYEAIQQGLARFEEKLFGTQASPQEVGQAGQMNALGQMSATEINYSLSKSSSIAIQTNDGDMVTIDFAEALAYQRSELNAAYASQNDDGSTSAVGYSETSESRYHAVGFSFSVEGELDEDEKAAIGELVQNVSELADEFFNGDLDKAFEQATQLGFDESELSGFALQMTRTETVSVAQAYAQVAEYNPSQSPAAGIGQSEGQGQGQNLQQMMRPVASYFNDLMAFLEQAREQLQDGNDLQSLMDNTVEKYLEFRGEDDINGGLERFAAFNQRILSTLEMTSGVLNQAPPAIDEAGASDGANSGVNDGSQAQSDADGQSNNANA